MIDFSKATQLELLLVQESLLGLDLSLYDSTETNTIKELRRELRKELFRRMDE